MAIRFNTQLLCADVDKKRKRGKITVNKLETRIGLSQGLFKRMLTGEVKEITVNTLARLVDYLNEYDISKYIYNDGE